MSDMSLLGQLRGRIDRLRGYNKDHRAEIERLKDDAIHNEGVMVALREGYTEAKARVEELEIDLRHMEEQLEGQNNEQD